MINLYPCFKHLKDYNNIFIYSDPHFADEEMKHLRKDYIGDDEQVKAINSRVGKKDVLIILGDIGDTKYVAKLRGYKILIMGNHDKGATNYLRVKEGTKDNHLFDEVYEGAVCLNDKIILTHEPVNIPFMFNIHGHDHSGWAINDDMHLNVCAENINYTPVNLTNLVKAGLFKDVPNIHRIAIDKAIERREKRNRKAV